MRTSGISAMLFIAAFTLAGLPVQANHPEYAIYGPTEGFCTQPTGFGANSCRAKLTSHEIWGLPSYCAGPPGGPYTECTIIQQCKGAVSGAVNFQGTMTCTDGPAVNCGSPLVGNCPAMHLVLYSPQAAGTCKDYTMTVTAKNQFNPLGVSRTNTYTMCVDSTGPYLV